MYMILLLDNYVLQLPVFPRSFSRLPMVTDPETASSRIHRDTLILNWGEIHWAKITAKSGMDPSPTRLILSSFDHLD